MPNRLFVVLALLAALVTGTALSQETPCLSTAPIACGEQSPLVRDSICGECTNNCTNTGYAQHCGGEPADVTCHAGNTTTSTGDAAPSTENAAPSTGNAATQTGNATASAENAAAKTNDGTSVSLYAQTEDKDWVENGVGKTLLANPEKTTTVLGNYKRDMERIIAELHIEKSTDFGAKPGGFNVLNVPDDLYENPQQFWDEYNKPWLDQAIQRGDDIVLATPPESKYLLNASTGALTGFGREVHYLLENGYAYDAMTQRMVKGSL